MTALVEDMLLLARTDSGTIQIEPVPLDLADVAADAASSLATLGQERGVKVVLDPLPAPVSGDPLRLRQLVTILVDNAIRHSPKGSTVTVNVRPDAACVLAVRRGSRPRHQAGGSAQAMGAVLARRQRAGRRNGPRPGDRASGSSTSTAAPSGR